MIDLLKDNPLLLLFAVSAIGYGLGRLRVLGLSLGVAAVLFVGLAMGALHPEIQLPEFVYQFGLVLFVYCMGLSAGPGFVASLRRRGLAQNALVVGVLTAAAGLVLAIKHLLGLQGTIAAGLFAGSLTNTPALAGLFDYLRHHPGTGDLTTLLAEPVIGYSLTYPGGVIGMMLAMQLAQRLWRVDYAAEARASGDAVARDLHTVTVRITHPEATGRPLCDVVRDRNWQVAFGRRLHGDGISVCHEQTCLEMGDLVTVIGDEQELQPTVAFLGEQTDAHLEFDRSQLDFRRMFVSRADAVGRPLAELQLEERFGAPLTRVRRGDVDLLARPDTVLEPGDRVRVLAPPARMETVSRFFGDSYKHLSEVDVVSLGLGIALGLLLGALPLPLPGGTTLKLGIAGGPLLVGLVLGYRGRSGSIIWNLPYSANLTLRQVGVLLFLAGIGTRSGHAFAETLRHGGWLSLLLAGAGVTLATALTTLWVGHRLLRIPLGTLLGVLAGLQTQPALLAFAGEQTGDDRPNAGYATVYPAAMVAKIVLAQLLLIL